MGDGLQRFTMVISEAIAGVWGQARQSSETGPCKIWALWLGPSTAVVSPNWTPLISIALIKVVSYYYYINSVSPVTS